MNDNEVMSRDARPETIDVSTLPTHIAQAYELRRTLCIAATAQEETWMTWARAKETLADVNKTFRGAGRDPVAMERRRVARENEQATREVYARWSTQKNALASAWIATLPSLARREVVWVYMVTAENETQRDGYFRQVRDLDTKARVKEVQERGGVVATLASAYERYGRAWYIKSNRMDRSITVYDQAAVEEWARAQNAVLTGADFYVSWIVFDFAG